MLIIPQALRTDGREPPRCTNWDRQSGGGVIVMSDEQHVDLQPAPVAEPGHLTTQLANAVPDAGGRRRPGRPAYVAASLLDHAARPDRREETGLSAAHRTRIRGSADDDPAREHATLLRVEDPEPLDMTRTTPT